MANSASAPGIVVLGLPRSGTTLLRRLINAHPAIHCGGETFLLRAAARFLESDTIVDGIDYGVVGGLGASGVDESTINARLRHMVETYFEEMATAAGKPRWASKTAVDSFYTEEIERVFGDHVQFVCVVRHGADVVLSLIDLSQANEAYIDELHRYVGRYQRPLEAFAHAWVDITGALINLAARRPENVHLLSYEGLTANPDQTLRSLFVFLGESYDKSLIGRAMSGHDVRGLGDWKTWSRRGIDSDSTQRWKCLRADQLSRLGRIMNPTLERGGWDPLPVSALPDSATAMRRYELAMMINASSDENDQAE